MRPFSFLLLIVLGSFIYGGCGEAVADSLPPEKPIRPNILLILADDLGYHDLGCTGSEYYETPNIDRLAREGTAFTQAYATCQVCSPSRASIMLGQFPARHGITDWIGARTGAAWRESRPHTSHLPPDYAHQLPAGQLTVAEALRAGGYQTFFSGKWHLGGEGSGPEDHGFAKNVGGWDKGSPIGGFFDPYDNPELPNRLPGENLSMRLARETKDFITQNEDSSFFAMLSFYAVHAPLETTEERWDRYRQKALENGVAGEGFAMERRLPIRVTQDHPVYAGLVEQMDLAVGLVLDALDSLGLADNTVVVFTSDNGGVASGDAYATSNLPLRGGKGYQWEGGIREPFLLRGPGIAAGEEIDVPVTGADIYPSLLGFADLPGQPGQHLDGRDIRPLLLGESWGERPLFWHYPHYGNQGGDPSAIIRRGDWKLIHYWEDDRDELYHLGRDPKEQNDLAATEASRTEEMRRELMNWLSEVGARYPASDDTFDPAVATAWRKRMETTKKEGLEESRRKMFEAEWEPNADWWDSALLDDREQ